MLAGLPGGTVLLCADPPTWNARRAAASTVLRLMEDARLSQRERGPPHRARPHATLLQAAARQGQRRRPSPTGIMSTGPDFLTGETTEDVNDRHDVDPAMQAAAEAALDEVFATQKCERDRWRRTADRGDVGGRRGARHGGRAATRRARDLLQPRDAGAAADRIVVQAPSSMPARHWIWAGGSTTSSSTGP